MSVASLYNLDSWLHKIETGFEVALLEVVELSVGLCDIV